MTEYQTYPSTAHALGCGMNNGRPVIACVCGLPNKPCPGGAVGGGPGECCNTPARFPLDLPPMPEPWDPQETSCFDDRKKWIDHAFQIVEIAQAQAALADGLAEALAQPTVCGCPLCRQARPWVERRNPQQPVGFVRNPDPCAPPWERDKWPK